MSPHGQSTQTPQPTINVTPLVDVVLVLLIIFMVVAPKLEQDVAVKLPSVFNADPDAGTAAPIVVSMATPAACSYEGQLYGLDDLTAALEAAHVADPSRRLVLRADFALSYGSVRELQRRMQEIGFPGLSFLVNERHRWDDQADTADRRFDAPPPNTSAEPQV